MHFGVWHPISQSGTAAPEEAGVLQTRAEGVLDYRSGRSAMILYACSADDETLRGFFAMGLLITVTTALDMHEIDEPWARALTTHADDC